MFSVIYRFHIKPGRIDDLRSSWRDLTQGFLQHCGSWGSRLHKSDQPDVYVAYAQWPTREQREAAQLPAQYGDAQRLMAESCHSIETLYELEASDDLLEPPPRSAQ